MDTICLKIKSQANIRIRTCKIQSNNIPSGAAESNMEISLNMLLSASIPLVYLCLLSYHHSHIFVAAISWYKIIEHALHYVLGISLSTGLASPLIIHESIPLSFTALLLLFPHCILVPAVSSAHSLLSLLI